MLHSREIWSDTKNLHWSSSWVEFKSRGCYPNQVKHNFWVTLLVIIVIQRVYQEFWFRISTKVCVTQKANIIWAARPWAMELFTNCEPSVAVFFVPHPGWQVIQAKFLTLTLLHTALLIAIIQLWLIIMSATSSEPFHRSLAINFDFTNQRSQRRSWNRRNQFSVLTPWIKEFELV